MTEMTLAQAIAEVKRLDRESRVIPDAVAQVLVNGLLSGDLIPRTDAEQAVAAAYQVAGDAAYDWMTSNDPVIREARVEAAIAFFETDTDKTAEQVRDTILALAPAEPLAEVQALKAERDRLRAGIRHVDDVNDLVLMALARDEAHARAEAAETEVARLTTILQQAEEALRATGSSYQLRVANDIRAALAPQKDATP